MLGLTLIHVCNGGDGDGDGDGDGSGGGVGGINVGWQLWSIPPIDWKRCKGTIEGSKYTFHLILKKKIGVEIHFFL